MLENVIMPSTITVHLAKPNHNAENLTVSFSYYIKNVACSEIYSHWPREAIKANVLAQISLALNRIYTQWYHIQGYNFDITNSTYFDQAFVKNQTLQKSICTIVDEVLGFYIEKRNFFEPYYSEYCDGKKVSCKGMKQWGSYDLANRGFQALEILQYYYSNQIHLKKIPNRNQKTSNNFLPLKYGMNNQYVKKTQMFLNGIALDYPNIPTVFPVDGVFGPNTEKSILEFQKYFQLDPDGIVGNKTWNKLCYIFIAVRKLAQLNSKGFLPTLYNGIWQKRVLKTGDRSIETQLLQYYLSIIAKHNHAIKISTIDGRYGIQTKNSIEIFQEEYGLLQDGIVGQSTWNQIYVIYTKYKKNKRSSTSLAHPQY